MKNLTHFTEKKLAGISLVMQFNYVIIYGVLHVNLCILYINFLSCLQTDEFLARHFEEKARMRQAQQEEKRKVLFIISFRIHI